MSSHPSLSELQEFLRQQLPFPQQEFHVSTLSLFGSYVRQENRLDSDLDLLVTFQETPSLFKYIELENHLSDLLGIKVDLVLQDSLKPAIGERILREAISV